MKKILSVLLALAVCLSLWACDKSPAEDISTKPNLNNFDILGDWVIADEYCKKITFFDNGTCSIAGEETTVYCFYEATAVVTIGYDAKSYQVESADGYYRLIGEHYILREDDTVKIAEITQKEQTYSQAVTTLTAIDVDMAVYYPSWETMLQASRIYQMLLPIDGYKDVSQILSRFSHCIYDGDSSIMNHIYDSAGNEVGRFSTSSSGEYRTRYAYKYDAKNNLISITLQTCKGGYVNNVYGSSCKTFIYDENGKLILENFSYDLPYHDYYTYRYSYDNEGKLIKKTLENASEYYSQGPSFYIYEYDTNGRLYSMLAYGEYGCGTDMLSEKTVYYYDKNGKTIKDETYRYDSSVEELTFSHSNQYEYSAEGILTKRIQCYADSTFIYNYSEIYWYNGK